MHKFIASFAAAAILAAVPATAQQAPSRSVTVSTADLDLTTASGRAKLDRRIATATETVCGSYAGAFAGEDRAIAKCRADVGRQLAARDQDKVRVAVR